MRLHTPGLVLAGALIPFGFAPFGWWLATIAGLALAFALMADARSLRDGAWRGWLVGVGKYGVGASWVYVSIHEQGGASPELASFLVGLFVVGMALFSALFGALFALAVAPLRPGASGAGASGTQDAAPSSLAVVAFVAAWVLAEWSLTWLLTGFPWLFVGYAAIDTAVAGFAPVMGVLGLSTLLVLGAALLVVAWRGGRHARLGGALYWLALFGVGYGLGHIEWTTAGEPRDAALVQGNVEQLTKWNPENRRPIVALYDQMTADHWEADLVIWPEAAITTYGRPALPLLARWRAKAARSETTLVFGMPDVRPDAAGDYRYYNSVHALGLGSGQYDKQRLVPFGEYVPLEGLLRGLIQFFDLPMSRSDAGPADQPPLDLGLVFGPQGGSEPRAAARGETIGAGIAICYEIAYPRLVRLAARASEVLITVSNDTWFGASIGPYQHLELARMRALENGRYVLRATNNGITAVIDSRGRVVSALPQFEAGVLRGSWSPHTGSTPYTTVGDWVLLLVLVLALLVSRRQRATTTAP
ncbi:MAG: apolipoprotein N-acyltransferase [Pseudomonadota bacterium]